jgi:hypothetical protein
MKLFSGREITCDFNRVTISEYWSWLEANKERDEELTFFAKTFGMTLEEVKEVTPVDFAAMKEEFVNNIPGTKPKN